MSYLEKENELTIRNWGKEIMHLTKSEFMILLDVCLEDEYLHIEEREEKMQGFTKRHLLTVLQEIYSCEAYKDERVKKLYLIVKTLYTKIYSIADGDVFYIMKEIINAKSFIAKFGLLDLFWQENEVTQVKNELIDSICRIRHLKLLKMSV